MPDLTLGSTPARLTVWLVDAAPFNATVTASDEWPAAPELVFDDGTVWTGTLSGDNLTAGWALSASQVATLVDAAPRRATLRDPGSHVVYAHGTVYRTRVVESGDPSVVAGAGTISVDTATIPSITYNISGGGAGGGSDVLTVVDGEPVELDDDLPVGHLLGFRVLSSTVIGGRTFAPGDYIVSRTVTGWDFRLLAAADTLEPDPVPDVEVTAAGPTWADDEDNGGGSWTTPTEVGVTYSPASGTADPGEEVTVTATALEGYDLIGPTSWVHTFPASPAPPDTTNPTAGTLAVTGVTHNAATLTVTGATDNQSLHGAPYAFSTNNGSTWTGWQTSNIYTASGLTPSTSYQFRHKVRDTSSNEATGTAQSSTTAAAPVVTPAYTTEVQADNPLVYIPFTETALPFADTKGAMTLATADTVGAIGANPAAQDVGGMGRSALFYNNGGGGNSLLTGGDPAALRGLTAFTVEMLVRPSSIPASGNRYVLSYGYDQNPRFGLYFTSSAVVATIKGAAHTDGAVVSAAPLVANTDYHLAVTYDGTFRVYVNGASVGTPVSKAGHVTGGADTVQHYWALGHWAKSPTAAGASTFLGHMAGVAFHGSALSAARILAHAQAAGVA